MLTRRDLQWGAEAEERLWCREGHGRPETQAPAVEGKARREELRCLARPLEGAKRKKIQQRQRVCVCVCVCVYVGVRACGGACVRACVYIVIVKYSLYLSGF